MKLKTVLLSVSAAALTLSMSSAFAGLTLCSKNYANQIDTTCNGKNGVPIPASSNTTSCASDFGMTNLPWAALRLKFGSTHFTCQFKDHNSGATIGSADLTISGSSGEITNQSITGPGLSLVGGPFNQTTSEVTATIVQN